MEISLKDTFNKRYLLFAYDQYYPNGGLNDLKGSFNNLEELIKYINSGDFGYHELIDIYDLKEYDVIYVSYYYEGGKRKWKLWK